MPSPRTALSRLALVAALGLTAACGSNDPDTVGREPAEDAFDVLAEQDDAAVPAELEQRAGEVEPVELELRNGVSTAVVLDEEFLSGLEGLGVTPAPVGDASIEDGRASFPITGGDITYYGPESGVEPFVQGEILHEGSGLRLTGPDGTVVELTDFVVDPGESVLTGTATVDGAVAAREAPLFFLDGRTLEPLETDAVREHARLDGTTVSLTRTAADTLNEVFGVEALTEFFPVGTAEITLGLPRG